MAAMDKSADRFTLISLIFAAVLGFATCSQQFIITHSPQYISFIPTANSISNSEISKVVALGLGFTPKKDLEWNGMSQGSAFHKPKANVLLSIEGFTNSAMKLDVASVAKYATVGDVPMPDTSSIVNHIQSTTFTKEPLIVDFTAGNTVFELQSQYPELFRKLPSTLSDIRRVLSEHTPAAVSLNISKDADLLFLGEMHLVRQIVQMLKKDSKVVKDTTPDVYNLHLSGLRKLVETHGATSVQVKEALALLSKFVQEITGEFKALYGGHVMVEVVTLSGVEEGHVRKTRSLMAAPPAPGPQTLEQRIHVAEDYDETYPAIFNIILWTMVILIISIFAISVCTWFMDPGRDSIIYRMTAQRLKKD